MGDKSQDHKEQEANPQLIPAQEVQDQAPVSELTSPAVAAQRVRRAPPSATRPSDILAMQRTVGNRAVQRVLGRVQPRTVAPGTIQRHMSDGTRSQWFSVNAQEEAAIAEGAAGMAKTRSGIDEWRAGSNSMVQGFNALQDVARAAAAEPVTSPSEGGSASPQSGGGEQTSTDEGEEIIQ